MSANEEVTKDEITSDTNDGTTEETKDVKTEEVVETTTEESSEITETKEDVTKKAKSTGHLTLEEYVAKGGKPEDYKTEKEYVLTGELIELKKTIQKRDKDIEEILKYNNQVIENHKAQVREQLRVALANAKANGDVDAIEKFTQQKVQMEIDDKNAQASKSREDLAQIDREFLEDNKTWCNSQHPELVELAKQEDLRLMKDFPTLSYAQKAQEIGKIMKLKLAADERYKHLVVNTDKIERPVISAVKSNVVKSSTTSTDSEAAAFQRLSSTQKHMYGILKRINEKENARSTKKVSFTVKNFLEYMKKDEEI